MDTLRFGGDGKALKIGTVALNSEHENLPGSFPGFTAAYHQWLLR